MTPQELKNSILQLAIQGKLVEQRSEEGTGEELYRQIQKEKQELIKAGKIKKDKPFSEITEDDVPFDIPESWKWVRLNEIANSMLGKTLNKTSDSGELCQYLCSINVYWDGITLDTVKQACFTNAEKEKYRLEIGDLLICEGGDAGRCAIWDKPNTMYFQNALHRVRFLGNVSVEFYRSIFEFYKSIGIIKRHCKGETIQHLVQGELYNILFPLPPIAEQKRIVSKIEELLPLIDRYEKAWSRLEDFNKRFPVDMQKSILQMAIQGKLVEQRPEEGTGEELYRQIQAEKQKLIKEGKIKKEKPLPEISEDEIPFDIPEGWKWVRLKEITTKITDGTHHSPTNFESGEYKYVTAKNIKSQGVMLSNITYVSEDVHNEIFSRCNPEYGDVLLIKDGATTGVATVNNLDEPFSMLSSVALLKMPENMCAWYLVYVLRSDLFYKAVRAQMKGTGITRITLKQIEPMVVPLPPLAEQKRIVAKLEEILPLCKRI